MTGNYYYSQDSNLNGIPDHIPGTDGHLVPESRAQQVVVGKVGDELDECHWRHFFQSRLDVAVCRKAAEKGHVVASADVGV